MKVYLNSNMLEDMTVFLTDGSREDYRKVCTELGLNGYVFHKCIDFENAMAFQYITFDEQEHKYSAFVVHPKEHSVMITTDTDRAYEIAVEQLENMDCEHLSAIPLLDDWNEKSEVYEAPDGFGNSFPIILMDDSARINAEKREKEAEKMADEIMAGDQDLHDDGDSNE